MSRWWGDNKFRRGGRSLLRRTSECARLRESSYVLQLSALRCLPSGVPARTARLRRPCLRIAAGLLRICPARFRDCAAIPGSRRDGGTIRGASDSARAVGDVEGEYLPRLRSEAAGQIGVGVDSSIAEEGPVAA